MSWRHKTYATVTGHPHVKAIVEALPKSVVLADGLPRRSSMRVWRLIRSWQGVAGGPEEAAGSFEAYEGGDMIDVGAYEGWYSVLLAPKANPGDHFVSFEPDARMFADLLSMQADLQRIFPELHLWAIPEPLGDGSPTELQWPEEGVEGHPRFAGAATGDAPSSITIDDFVSVSGLIPKFVKIDVEGAEWFVLRGMSETLVSSQPIIMLELHPTYLPEGVDADQVEALLADKGYRKSVVQRGDVSERQVWRPPAR